MHALNASVSCQHPRLITAHDRVCTLLPVSVCLLFISLFSRFAHLSLPFFIANENCIHIETFMAGWGWCKQMAEWKCDKELSNISIWCRQNHSNDTIEMFVASLMANCHWGQISIHFFPFERLLHEIRRAGGARYIITIVENNSTSGKHRLWRRIMFVFNNN